MKLISCVTNKDVGHLIFTLADGSGLGVKIFSRGSLAHSHMVQGGRAAVPEFENLYLFGMGWHGVIKRSCHGDSKKGQKILWTWWLTI